MARSTHLVIKLTAGLESPEKVSQAFSVATAGVVSGLEVSFWLTGEASHFASPGFTDQFKLEHAGSITEHLQTLLTNGKVYLCSQCAKRRELDYHNIIDGITIAGATSFVEEITADSTQAIVY